jgi:DHA3 family macrolide efflux protein-like MFS transporter
LEILFFLDVVTAAIGISIVAFLVFSMISSVMMPLGMMVFGPVADTVSINIILVGTGAVITLPAIPLIRSKTLREAGKTQP